MNPEDGCGFLFGDVDEDHSQIQTSHVENTKFESSISSLRYEKRYNLNEQEKPSRFPTPHFVDSEKFVYSPSHDTFLLMNAIENDLQTTPNFRPLICIEVGGGSGLVITFLAKQLGSRGSCAAFFATDLNLNACHSIQQTGKMNEQRIEVLNCDLTSPLDFRLCGLVDILIFNPPYVPTDHTEMIIAQHSHSNSTDSIVASWAGGLNGREVVDRFLPSIPSLLAPNGRCYIVALKENNPSEMMTLMKTQHHMNSRIIAQQFSISEHLFIIRFDKKGNTE
jgi:release factor glutamine methyltransferase